MTTSNGHLRTATATPLLCRCPLGALITSNTLSCVQHCLLPTCACSHVAAVCQISKSLHHSIRFGTPCTSSSSAGDSPVAQPPASTCSAVVMRSLLFRKRAQANGGTRSSESPRQSAVAVSLLSDASSPSPLAASASPRSACCVLLLALLMPPSCSPCEALQLQLHQHILSRMHRSCNIAC